MSDITTELLEKSLMSILEEHLEGAKTQEEADKIIKKFEEMDIGKISLGMYEKMSKDITSYMRESMYEEVMSFRAEELEYLSIQEQKWGKAFVSSESMYIMVLEAAQEYGEYVNTLPQEELQKHYFTYTAILHIHGRAMQQFLEIITLMKNGFADGAYGRWKSMYELFIIATFIKENGENVAKEFIKASETEDRYEWARSSGLFKKQQFISFNAIKNKCKIDSSIWKNQYILANRVIHASPQGTLRRLSNMGTKDIIPVGRSDFGLTTPAEHSAISLVQITNLFFSIHPSGDSIVAMKYITNWIEVVREIYFKTHDLIFPDEEKLWDENMKTYESDVVDDEKA